MLTMASLTVGLLKTAIVGNGIADDRSTDGRATKTGILEVADDVAANVGDRDDARR